MAKLHELLAVENTLGETANRIRKETTKTLATKETIFAGMTKEHIIFDDELQHLKQATDVKEVQSTTDEQLKFLTDNLIKYWDVTYQKDDANQRAFADIVIDGKTIVEKVPSTTLLSMEKKLDSILATYNALPTLDAAKAWKPAEGYGKKGVWVTVHDRENQHTITYKNYEEVSPATKEHKAQIVQVEKTDVIGKYIIKEFSGAVTSLDKAERLERLTKLIAAVKTARQRANSVEVNTKLKFADAIIGYING